MSKGEFDPSPDITWPRQRGMRVRVLAALCMVLLGWSVMTDVVPAAELEPSADAIHDEVNTLMSAPPFVSEHTLYRWRYRGDSDDEPEEQADRMNSSLLSAFLGGVGEGMLWLFVGIAVVLLIIHRRRWLGLFQPAVERREVVLPAALFGREEAAEPLPEDVVGTAWSLWQQGERRRCLSLLYRAALLDLIRRRHVELPASATEEDCLSRVRVTEDGELVTYFTQLTRDWQRAAYAASWPDEQAVRALCDDWRLHFGG